MLRFQYRYRVFGIISFNRPAAASLVSEVCGLPPPSSTPFLPYWRIMGITPPLVLFYLEYLAHFTHPRDKQNGNKLRCHFQNDLTYTLRIYHRTRHVQWGLPGSMRLVQAVLIAPHIRIWICWVLRDSVHNLFTTRFQYNLSVLQNETEMIAEVHKVLHWLDGLLACLRDREHLAQRLVYFYTRI